MEINRSATMSPSKLMKKTHMIFFMLSLLLSGEIMVCGLRLKEGTGASLTDQEVYAVSGSLDWLQNVSAAKLDLMSQKAYSEVAKEMLVSFGANPSAVAIKNLARDLENGTVKPSVLQDPRAMKPLEILHIVKAQLTQAKQTVTQVASTLKVATGIQAPPEAQCADLNCGVNSFCTEGKQPAVKCECLKGYMMEDGACVAQKIFPSQLLFPNVNDQTVADVKLLNVGNGRIVLAYRSLKDKGVGHVMLGQVTPVSVEWKSVPTKFSIKAAFDPQVISLGGVNNVVSLCFSFRIGESNGDAYVRCGSADFEKWTYTMGPSGPLVVGRMQSEPQVFLPFEKQRKAVVFLQETLHNKSTYGSAKILSVDGNNVPTIAAPVRSFWNHDISRMTGVNVGGDYFALAFRGQQGKEEATALFGYLKNGDELVVNPYPAVLEARHNSSQHTLSLVALNVVSYSYYDNVEHKGKERVLEIVENGDGSKQWGVSPSVDLGEGDAETVLASASTVMGAALSSASPTGGPVTYSMWSSGKSGFSKLCAMSSDRPELRQCKEATFSTTLGKAKGQRVAATRGADTTVIYAWPDEIDLPRYQLVAVEA